MNVVAIDPGGTTGMVFHEWNSGALPNVVQEPWEVAQNTLWNAVESAPDHVTIVCERYTITMQTLKKSRQYEALYVIGGLLLMERRLPCTLVLQKPGEAKGLVTDDKLKRMDLYDITRGLEHGRDALRHLIHYGVMNNRIDPRSLLG